MLRLLGIGLALACAGTAAAQQFLAEWSEDDVGRLGPTGLALDKVGTATYLYAADQVGGRIFKIDVATGTRAGVYGQVGNGPVEFNNPYGIAVDPVSHDLYIAERGNDRVQRITNTGQFVTAWGGVGTAPGQFESPIGIAADANGNVYVVDHDNSRVQKFHVQANGTGWDVSFVTSWGSLGAAHGQFDAPYGIALDAAGNVWVADGRNHRVQKFDANGNFLAAVGTYGTGDGQFVTPTWVSFDSKGAMYVAETNTDPQNTTLADIDNQRIQKFNPDGTFALKWGSYGEAGGQFKLPFDVVVDANNNAYVSDYYNTRLQKFSLDNPPNPPPPPPPPPPTGGDPAPGAANQFINVSSRLRTSADRPLFAGFTIGGNAPKQVLVRAVGPGLAQYGVTGVLPNPKLQVYAGTKLIAENEDWGGDAAVSAAASKVGAFGLPATSKDAALLLTLQPGVYSAQVVANGGDGVAIVEVYDADGATASKVINLSTRGVADTGDGVLVAGFVIKGTDPKRVLIRGIGPALTVFGVTGVVADPTLKVVLPNGTVLAQNDNWGTQTAVSGGPTPGSPTELSAAFTATGAFGLPSGSKDGALLITLPPGLYNAIVSGVNNTTGGALVEVYEVPVK